MTQQETAEAWSNIFDQIVQKNKEKDQVTYELHVLQEQLVSYTRELESRVHSNISIRVFSVSPTEVVIVEYKSGVRKQTVERPEA